MRGSASYALPTIGRGRGLRKSVSLPEMSESVGKLSRSKKTMNLAALSNEHNSSDIDDYIDSNSARHGRRTLHEDDCSSSDDTDFPRHSERRTGHDMFEMELEEPAAPARVNAFGVKVEDRGAVRPSVSASNTKAAVRANSGSSTVIDLTSDGETDVTFSPRASAVSVNQQSSSFRRLRRVPDAQTSVIGRPIERPPSASPNDAPLSSRPDSPLVVASVTLSHSPSPSTGGSFLASSQSASLLSRHTTQPPTYSRPAQPFNATAESVRAEFFELARIYGWLENPAMAKQVMRTAGLQVSPSSPHVASSSRGNNGSPQAPQNQPSAFSDTNPAALVRRHSAQATLYDPAHPSSDESAAHAPSPLTFRDPTNSSSFGPVAPSMPARDRRSVSVSVLSPFSAALPSVPLAAPVPVRAQTLTRILAPAPGSPMPALEEHSPLRPTGLRRHSSTAAAAGVPARPSVPSPGRASGMSQASNAFAASPLPVTSSPATAAAPAYEGGANSPAAVVRPLSASSSEVPASPASGASPSYAVQAAPSPTAPTPTTDATPDSLPSADDDLNELLEAVDEIEMLADQLSANTGAAEEQADAAEAPVSALPPTEAEDPESEDDGDAQEATEEKQKEKEKVEQASIEDLPFSRRSSHGVVRVRLSLLPSSSPRMELATAPTHESESESEEEEEKEEQLDEQPAESLSDGEAQEDQEHSEAEYKPSRQPRDSESDSEADGEENASDYEQQRILTQLAELGIADTASPRRPESADKEKRELEGMRMSNIREQEEESEEEEEPASLQADQLDFDEGVEAEVVEELYGEDTAEPGAHQSSSERSGSSQPEEQEDEEDEVLRDVLGLGKGKPSSAAAGSPISHTPFKRLRRRISIVDIPDEDLEDTREPDTTPFRTPSASRTPVAAGSSATPLHTPSAKAKAAGKASAFTDKENMPQNLVTPSKSAVPKSASKAKAARASEGIIPFADGVSFKRQRDSLARTCFEVLNEQVFGGQLPENMEIRWSKTLNTTAGRCLCKRQGAWLYAAEIELATKVVDDTHKLQNTLCHELCHAAAWLVNHINNPPHGRCFQSWARKAEAVFPSLDIKTCHSYQINYKYQYRCTNPSCGRIFPRHSKSLDTDRFACGKCGSRIELPGHSTTDADGNKTPSFKLKKDGTPAKPSAFSLFVQQHYAEVRKAHVGMSHAGVMSLLSTRWKQAQQSGSLRETGEELAPSSPNPA